MIFAGTCGWVFYDLKFLLGIRIRSTVRVQKVLKCMKDVDFHIGHA